MTKVSITIEIDDDNLASCTSPHLATLWHVAQANPAHSMDKDAGALAERIGREIIRRWLRGVSPELWHHQGHHYYWNELRKLGKWKDGEFVPDTAGPGAETSVETGAGQ
jgi:hypothetical protein